MGAQPSNHFLAIVQLCEWLLADDTNVSGITHGDLEDKSVELPQDVSLSA